VAAESGNLVAMEAILNHIDKSELLSCLNGKDRTGNVPLHYAVQTDHVDCMKKLIEFGADLMITNSTSSNLVHAAVMFNSRKALAYLSKHELYTHLLQKNDMFGRGPLELASLYGYNCEHIKTNGILNFQESNLSFPVTGIVSDQACLNHHTCPPSEATSASAPPENIHRLEVLIDKQDGVLRSSSIRDKLSFVEESREASIADILRVHEWPYLRKVQVKCESLAENPEAENGIGFLDGDTTISKESFNAALKAAGAVCTGVDLVMNQKMKNVFCPIRPPGHHAGRPYLIIFVDLYSLIY
jgi:ankyrin repeat protein